MPARINFKEGDYVDKDKNIIYIKDIPYEKYGRRRVRVFDTIYQEYFEAYLNDIRTGKTKHGPIGQKLSRKE
jgi:hypothetical protein